MPAQTSRNHSTLHEVDAWLGVEDFDEQMEKGTPYDALGLLMKPLWSVLDAAADLGPRSADVSTNCVASSPTEHADAELLCRQFAC